MAKRKTKKNEPKKQDPYKRMDEASGIFVPAGLLMGMGIGFAVDALVAGLFIGLGAGLLGMAIFRMLHFKK